MSKTTLERFLKNPAEFLRSAQRERLLITRKGHPVAVLVGLENKDEEDLAYEASPEFWRMIRQRRDRPTVSLEAVKAELRAGKSPANRKKGT